MASLISKLGAEQTEVWAKGGVANMARPPKGGDRDLMTAVYGGEADLAVVNTYYFGHLVAAHAPGILLQQKAGVIFPDQHGRGTHVNGSGSGVLRYAPNRGKCRQIP